MVWLNTGLRLFRTTLVRWRLARLSSGSTELWGRWAGIKWPPLHMAQNHPVIGFYPYSLTMSMPSGCCLRSGLKPSQPWDLYIRLLQGLLPFKVTTPIHRTPIVAILLLPSSVIFLGTLLSARSSFQIF